MENFKELTHTYTVTPGLCNARRELPVTLLISNIIEIATEHANKLGIGFLYTTPKGIGWVLTRLSLQMSRYPSFNEQYSITTWVESLNRFYSVRDFAISDSKGEIIGYVRSAWMLINLTSHTTVGTEAVPFDASLVSDRPCIVDNVDRKPKQIAEEINKYRFRYTDIDFYGHVNTVRYVELILNQFPLSLYETSHVHRMELSFHKEARYAEQIDVEKITLESSTPSFNITLRRDKDMLFSCRIIFS